MARSSLSLKFLEILTHYTLLLLLWAVIAPTHDLLKREEPTPTKV
jgi:hypothetical protein